MPPQIDAWLDAISLADVVIVLAWIGGLAVALKWLMPLGEALRAITDDWRGTPARPGRPAVPGVYLWMLA